MFDVLSLSQNKWAQDAPAMKRFGIALLGAIGGYMIASVAGYFLIDWLSSNTHDRSVEAAMTSAFFLGPLGALVGLIAGIVVGRRTATDGARVGS